MIISERQLIELMNIARTASKSTHSGSTYKKMIADLIYEIERQQSKQLKVVE